jgi:SOS-response transcriptional repressor LexA
MPKTDEKVIRIAAVDRGGGDCSGAEPFALVVLGDSMTPEFVEGDVIVVEPEGLATDGSFVVAQVDGEWTMRQLARLDGGWMLRPLNPTYPPTALADLSPIRGVVIQKSKPGRRRASKRYVE